MSYDVHFEMKSGYVFVRVSGENSAENVHAYMQDVLEHCGECDCFRVLIHECLDGPRLEAMQIFDLASEGSMRVLGRFDAVAYVDEQMGEMADFAETVAVNRGMPLRMFSNLREATRWIGRQVEDSDSKNIFTGKADGKPHFGA